MAGRVALAAICLLCGLAATANAASWYVNAATGDDNNPGNTPDTPWKTLVKVQTMQWWGQPFFGPGDTIYLSGNFTKGFYIAMGQMWGTRANPLTITSLDPNNRAVISTPGNDAIAVWDVGNGPSQLGLRITDLNIVSDGALDVDDNSTTSGIIVWKKGAADVDGLEVRRVNISGFTLNGLTTGRTAGAGFIRNVVITDSYFFNNLGYPNIPNPIGGGVCLGGVSNALVDRCVGHNNGALNNSPGGGPSAFWAWDSEYVVFRNSTAFNNKTGLKDGGGFELDLALNHSVIEYCNSYNNYGWGLYICTVAGTPSNFNNTIRYSTSTGDANQVGSAGIMLYAPAGTYMQDTSIYGNTITINDPNKACKTWGWQGDGHYAFKSWGDTRNTKWFNNKVVCAPSGEVWAQNMTCGAVGNPPVQPSCQPMTEVVQLPPWATNPDAPAPAPSGLQAPGRVPLAQVAGPAAPAPSVANGTTYYVNSVNGSDSADGKTPATAWKTLDRVSAMSYSTSSRQAQPGDRFLLSGTFTKGLYLSLHSKSQGTPASPITIASADPANRATIAPTENDAITIYESASDPAQNIGLRFADLNLVGQNKQDNRGKLTSGISFWRGGLAPISYLDIRRVNATGWTKSGILITGSPAAGEIRNVTITDCYASNNPGAPNVNAANGNGISLYGVAGALVERCVASGNGAASNDAWNTPFGIGVYKSNSVVIRNCTANGNLGAYVYASGFVLDYATTNSVIEYCAAANNYGSGYHVRSRNSMANSNNTIRYSNSTGDGNGNKVAAFSVWSDVAAGSAVKEVSFYSNTVTQTDASQPCKLWGSDFNGRYALSLYGINANTRWYGNQVVCPGGAAVIDTPVTCNYLTNWKTQACQAAY